MGHSARHSLISWIRIVDRFIKNKSLLSAVAEEAHNNKNSEAQHLEKVVYNEKAIPSQGKALAF